MQIKLLLLLMYQRFPPILASVVYTKAPSIPGILHSTLTQSPIPKTLVVWAFPVTLYRGSTVPKIDVNVIKWNPENSWTPVGQLYQPSLRA